MLIEFFGQTVSSAKCHSLITLLFPGTSQNSPTAGWSGSLASVEACNELKREGGTWWMDVTEVEGKEVLDGRREEVG